MKDLQEKSNKNKLDLDYLNNFLLEKEDDYLDFLLQVKSYKEIDILNENVIFHFLKYNNFKKIPEKLWKDYSFCEKAVSQNGDALEYVPKKLRDYPLCEKAVSNKGEALNSVPINLKDYPLCEKAVSKNGLALDYVPKKLRDYPLCEKAVSVSGLALLHVPNSILDYYLLNLSYTKYKNLAKIVIIKNIKKYKKYLPQLIKDFPEDKEFLEKHILQEYISKEVRKLLKEYYLNKNKQ